MFASQARDEGPTPSTRTNIGEKMKLISFKDVTNLNIDSKTCFEWVSEMIKTKSDALLPSKISMKPTDDIFCNVMPSIISENRGGVKVVTRYPKEVPSLDSLLLLYDASNGKKLAVMDANWITAMRTGAVAVHSLQLLARKDYKTIAMMGLGNTARATLKILLDLNPDRQFQIKLLRYKDQAEDFIKRFEKYSNVEFSVVDTNIDLVKDSDVVISCVTSILEDVCPDEYYKPGVLVIPVHTRGFMNCDLFFDKVFADDYGHVHHFKNFDKFKQFAEVADIVNGNARGRESDDERILAYNIGISVHDVFFASKIYEMIEKQGIKVAEYDNQSPTEKFWI